MNQRKATCSTILAVLEERGAKYELDGETPISEVLTDEDKKKVKDTLFAMFRRGEVEMTEDAKAKYEDDAALKSYISGLVNNWIRKAPEFNAGSKYTPKNPGSRAGAGDEQVAEMKKLLKVTQDPSAKQKIQEAIDARIAEIKPEKQIEIDTSKLPDSLKHLVQKH